MSDDVVDFSPVRRAQTQRWARPNWQTGSAAVPLAVLGAALGAASLFGEWSSYTMPNGASSPARTLDALGSLGIAYVVALIALVTVAALVFFGDHPGGTRNLRVAGITLSGASLAVLAAIANVVTTDLEGPVFLESLSSISLAQTVPTQTLSWAFYAAAGALIALGVALLLPPATPRGPLQEDEDEDEGEFDDEAVDLTVTVEPVRGT